MTTILALDSSTDACSVALIHNNHVTSLFEIAAKSHTQRLLPMVDEVLREAGCEKRQLDAIAFGRGPGSFTGLRICLGVVQGLDRKSTRLNSSHVRISYAVFCLKKKNRQCSV